ncbi:MAG: YihY family inner membrane protein [Alphaproteobacteria bacterium]|nr:YihY family inner membrane protein [Alphaproteobacteria bacterium]
MTDNPPPSSGGLTASLHRAIWEVDIRTLPRWQAILLGVVRIGHAVIRSVIGEQLTLRAMSLVYTTLLSLVPLLAISFSVLKGFGVHNQIEPLLLGVLEPLGDKGVEITTEIIGFVENIKVGVLGFVGFALLFYTVVSLMQKIERAFNHTWHISRERSLGQQFRDYLSVIIIGPALVFAAVGIMASLLNTAVVEMLSAIHPFGFLIKSGAKLAPYVMIVGAFTFIYMFIPNTRVRLRSALIGGLIAGILWNATGWIFASFVVNSAQYAAIYSTFATLIMFLIWLYLGWLILLIGASISFHDQHPEYVTATRREMRLSNRVREKLALLIAYLIGESYYRNAPGWTADGLAQRLGTPMDATEAVLSALEARDLLVRTSAEPAAFLPARPLETTLVADVLHAARVADEDGHLNPDRLPHEHAVDTILRDLDEATTTTLQGRTLKDLALSGAAPCSGPKNEDETP